MENRQPMGGVSQDGGPTLPTELWPVLSRKLWHATHIDKALAIVAVGQIAPDAPATYANGYCRSIGGISLFDFRGPDEDAAAVLHCGWTRWLSGHHADGEDKIGVWFEIDPAKQPPHVASTELYAHYWANRSQDARGKPSTRDPMPRCEACHRGPIPLDAVKSVLLIDGDCRADYESVAADKDLLARLDHFRARVRAKPKLPPTMGDRMQEARNRIRREGK